MKRCSAAVGSAGLACVLSFASAPAQVASFRGVGVLPGNNSSLAYGVSGGVVVGAASAGQSSVPFRWTEPTGVEAIGLLPGSSYGGAVGVSDDGLIVVGGCGDGMTYLEAFRWTEASGMVSLGDLPDGDFFSSATGISGDGAVIVGTSATHGSPSPDEAFRWTQAGGMVGIGTLPGGGYSSANACSADGSVIVGDATDENFVFQAFRWTQAGGMVGLGQLPGGIQSQAFGTSADGSVVVGTGLQDRNFKLFARAIRWTEAGGMEDLGQLPPPDPDTGPGTGGNAWGVSPDGKIVVGDAIDGFGQTVAMIWDRHHGMRQLADVLVAQGLADELAGWFLVEAKAVSGTLSNLRIAGSGTNPSGYFEGFIATLSMCDADYNSDGFVDGIDADQFNNDFEAGNLGADYNGDGFVDGIDADQFNNDFEAGC